ncbi:MAG: GrpB family protein [Chloroflexota bacterium]
MERFLVYTGLAAYRDFLRHHSEIAGAYGILKKALALVFDEDIAGYRDAKRPFLQTVMVKARTERETGQADL